MSENGTRRIALLNNKGGVGKTMLTIALAEALALDCHRVLVVDMDPQANATRRLGITPNAATLTDVLRPGLETGAAAPAIRPCGWADDVAELIDVLPADLDLEDRVLEAGVPGATNRLRKALYGVDDDTYDFVLIDCPPSLKGHLTQMVLAALDGPGDTTDPEPHGDTVVIPIAAERDPVAGARRVVDYISYYRDDLGVPHLTCSAIIPNLTRAGVGLHADRLAQLTTAIPGVPVWGPPIPLRSRIADLQDDGMPLRSDRQMATSEVWATIRNHARRLAGNVDNITTETGAA